MPVQNLIHFLKNVVQKFYDNSVLLSKNLFLSISVRRNYVIGFKSGKKLFEGIKVLSIFGKKSGNNFFEILWRIQVK